MKKLTVVLAACGLLTVGAGPAVAHTETFATDAVQQGRGWGGVPFNGYVSGRLESARTQCLSGRTLKLVFLSGGTRTIIDVDKSSENGFWMLGGQSESPPDSYRVRLAPRTRGKGVHSHTCGGDVINDTFS